MGNLDPMAEEFRPTNPNHCAPPPTFLFRSPPPPPLHSQSYVFPYVLTPLVQLQSATLVEPIVGVTFSQFPPPVAAALSTSPTRSLLLSLVPSETVVSESTLTRELEASFGDVRGVAVEGLCEGMVMATVHFYNLQHAEAAFTAIRLHSMQQQKTLLRYHQYYCALPLMPPATPARGVVWAQYIAPACDYGQNQGTIVVFNLDSKVGADGLRELFEAFGPVKELRDAPLKKNQRFVEYFDIRDAERALKQMNGKEIHGRRVVIEFSRPGRGHYRNFFKPPPHHDEDTTSPSHMEIESGVTKGTDKPTANLDFASTEEAAMGEERRQYLQGSPPKRNSNSIGGTNTTTTTYQRQEGARIRNWNKGKHAKNKHEARFLIKEQDATVMDNSSNLCMDTRTTVMIKNIPNKYSQKLLLNMLDTHCNHCNKQIDEDDDQPLSSYDFVYLPIDFNNKCNVGYGFVNMTSPVAALRLYKAFHRQQWQVFNSRKICEVTYARVQGLEALKEHFKNSKFPYEMEQYCMPVVFSPPRDGRRLTQPLAIAIAILGSVHYHHHMSKSSQNGGIEGDDDEESAVAATTGTSCCSSDHELCVVSSE